MTWRTDITDDVAKQYQVSVRLESTPFGARVHAIDTLIDRAAADVARELTQDSDPVALQRRTARLALLLAWKATAQ